MILGKEARWRVKLVSASAVTIYETLPILRCVIYGKPKTKSTNKKVILFLSSLAAVAVAVPLAQADPRGGGGGHFGRAPARGGFAMTRGAGTFRQGGFN